MLQTRYALIVAGGAGLRMGSDIPKQFLELHSKPILMHTINAFYTYDALVKIIVVLPNEQIDFWKHLYEKHNFSIKHELVAGGSERFYSVKNGLAAISDKNSLVAIHDGVRPLVSGNTLSRCFETAKKYNVAIPVIDSVDSIRYIENNESKALERSRVKLVQTPQVFNTEMIKLAYEQAYSQEFTDDASVFENAGNQVHLVEGNSENLKITKPHDLQYASHFLLPL
ncbi:MAG: 2-C-methyl-D-erythritol 4-phosphate cytidylyltransferase [Bacteroidales bacterium]|nr:2-C-methyl-D-erythritol 4-phosphate cytidylyltransferase [Bacteroidales bacterium]